MIKGNSKIVNKVAKYLRREVTFNSLKPGKHIGESEIAGKFGISRVPVREAFRILQSEGYLEVKPNKGCFVKKISPDYLIETTLVYRKLVPVILEKAIPKYNSGTYEKAEKVLTKLEKSRDFQETGYLLWDFAKIIYYPSNMKYMLGILDEIYRHNIRLLNEFFENKEYAAVNVSEQRKFIELCKKNKKDEAIKNWLVYVEETIDIILLVNRK